MADTLRYIKVDFASHKEALLQRVRSRWPQQWNDFQYHGQNSFAMLIIDLMAWSMATMAYLINRVAGENFINTMTMRESAQRVGSLTGYSLRGPTPAVVQCEASLSVVVDGDVVIPAGTILRTTGSVPFEVTEDYTILAGSLTPVTPVVDLDATLSGPGVLSTNVKIANGSTFADLVDTTIDISEYAEVNQTIRFGGLDTLFRITSIASATGSTPNRLVLDQAFDDGTESTAAQTTTASIFDRRISLSQGQTITELFESPAVDTKNYIVKLAQSGVIDGSVEVLVNDEAWSPVNTFYQSSSEAKIFQVKTLTTNEVVVKFGDDTYGKMVPTEAKIEISYRVGGGTTGNVAVGTINTTISGFIGGTNDPVTVTIKNETSEGQGGQEAETTEQARVNIPFSTRTNDRAVTKDDYQTIAQGYQSVFYGSVAYARVSVPTTNSFLEGNIVTIYAWTTGSDGSLTNLSAPLKLALRDYLQSKAVGTDYVVIADGTSRPAPISLRFKTIDGHDIQSTKNGILATISDIITPLRPGNSIVYSDLLSSISSTTGVDSVEMATPTSDLRTTNPTELFSIPDDTHVYSVERTSGTTSYSPVDVSDVTTYTGVLPVFPVAAWSVRLFMGDSELTVMPDIEPGYARLYRSSILSASSTLRSRINLLTGQVTLYVLGAQGDLTLRLNTTSGYDRERSVNVYLGYSGTNTQSKRREIRSALTSWAQQLKVGGTIYGSEQAGLAISKSNITSVVLAVSGVVSVQRVALETPSSTDTKVPAASTELLRLGQIVINNSVD